MSDNGRLPSSGGLEAICCIERLAVWTVQLELTIPLSVLSELVFSIMEYNDQVSGAHGVNGFDGSRKAAEAE